jgi:hypothetical protein
MDPHDGPTWAGQPFDVKTKVFHKKRNIEIDWQTEAIRNAR